MTVLTKAISHIRHMPVLAFVQTEVQSGASCGYVLVEKDPGKEWVTAWYRSGDKEWVYGRYHFDVKDAYEDFFTRVREARIYYSGMVSNDENS